MRITTGSPPPRDGQIPILSTSIQPSPAAHADLPHQSAGSDSFRKDFLPLLILLLLKTPENEGMLKVVQLINPILSGWVNYFALGDSGECFTFIQDWVEKKVRRHMMRARNRKGFGWTRWSRQWLYTTLRLFNRYRVYRPTRKAAPA